MIDFVPTQNDVELLRRVSMGLPGDGSPLVYPAVPHQELVARDAEPELSIVAYLHLIWSRRWLVVAVTLTITLLSGMWVNTQPETYRAFAEISVGGRSPQIIRNQVNLGPSWWELERYVEEQVRVLSSRDMAKKVTDRLGLESEPALAGNPSERLKRMITVERIRETSMISLSITGSDPERIAEWLNTYVQEYIDTNIFENLSRARRVYEVIQERLNPLRKDLSKSEQDLMEFKEREDAIVFADQDKNVISEQVNTLTTEYAQAKAERIRLETNINALQRVDQVPLSLTTLPEFFEDATIQSLLGQQNQLEVELAEKLETYREGHPEIRELRSRLAGVMERITAQMSYVQHALRTDYEIALEREQSLYTNIQQLKQQSIELAKQTMEFERLKREYEQNKVFLEEMLARSKEVEISSTAGANNVRIIEPAIAPKVPISPNLSRSIVLSLLLGAMLGVGLVVGLDALDQTLRTPDQVERFLGLESLTALSRFDSKMPNFGREALLSLRTALMLASRDDRSQVLMITSSVPGEGKTTTVVELGKVLAMSGSRTLIIDGDLRKSRIHHLMEVPNHIGLTSVVLGEHTVEEAIHRSEAAPGLDFITSGPLPPNPPELFGKESFRRLIEQARQEYDWVIIDTPPVASVTDPVVCSRVVDMVLLVVEYGGPKRQTVQESIRQLRRARARIAGVLLNKVDLEQSHYYYYSRYSYYRYGYEEQGSA